MTATMNPPTTDQRYAEAMRLTDLAREYFDGDGVAARGRLRPASRAAVAIESLRVTARLIEIVSALLVERACADGTRDTPLPSRERDFTPVPERLGGPARAIVTAVRAMYVDAFPEAAE